MQPHCQEIIALTVSTKDKIVHDFKQTFAFYNGITIEDNVVCQVVDNAAVHSKLRF